MEFPIQTLAPVSSITQPLIVVNATEDDPHCPKDALTNSYGWFIQLLLATLAFMLLVVKRFCEPRKRRRSWLVWFYDTSKQGLGAALVHFVNIFLAGEFKGDPCTWYIVSFLLDSTVGLMLVWAGIRLSVFIGQKYRYPTLIFGEYGRPPSARAWAHQCLMYCGFMAFAKVLITALMRLPYWTTVRDVILAPISSPQARVVVVVLVIPFFINALIFWVTDNFLMVSIKSSISSSPPEQDGYLAQRFPADKVMYQRCRTSVSTCSSEADILITNEAACAVDDPLSIPSHNDVAVLGEHENLQNTPQHSPHHDAVLVHISPEHKTL